MLYLGVDGTILLLVVVALAVALWYVRRKQLGRLDLLARAFTEREPLFAARAVPFSRLIPPREPHQPEVEGHRLRGGLMCLPEPVDSVEAFLQVMFARRTPAVYLGDKTLEVTLAVAAQAARDGIDPRGKLVLPSDATELVHTLERTDLAGIWIVADAVPEHESRTLVEINRRFGCPVLLVNCSAVPSEYRPVA